jgi:hypothetical protein
MVEPLGSSGVSVNGGIVGFFSLEMSDERLATRIISEQTGIPSNKIRRGEINEVAYEKIKNAAVELQNLPLYIDDTGGLSIGQLAARARRLKRQRGLDHRERRAGRRATRLRVAGEPSPAARLALRLPGRGQSRYHSGRFETSDDS